MNERPYQLIDTYDMTLLRTFVDQDKAMQTFGSMVRLWGFTTARTLNLLYVDANEEEHLLCYGNDPQIIQWCKEWINLEIQLRLAGTDIIGLEEFIAFSGLYPTCSEKDTPFEILDFTRYNAHIGPFEIMFPSAPTRQEALAHAFIGYNEIVRSKHGKYANHETRASVSV